MVYVICNVERVVLYIVNIFEICEGGEGKYDCGTVASKFKKIFHTCGFLIESSVQITQVYTSNMVVVPVKLHFFGS